MFGPRFNAKTETRSLVLRSVEPQDLQNLPTQPDPAITQYLSEKTKSSLAGLYAHRERSDHYTWWRTGRDRVIWGIFDRASNTETLLGYTGIIAAANDSSSSEGWHEAESFMVLFEPEHRGKGLARTTHPYRSSFAFAIGVDCLRSSVVIENERSINALRGAGYLLIGQARQDEEGFRRYQFRQYAPEVGEYALTHAIASAKHLQIQSPMIDHNDVLVSQGYTRALGVAFPEVQEAATQWLQEAGNQLVYLPNGRTT